MDGFAYDGFGEMYIKPRNFVTFDYETGYMHATEDCQTRSDNMLLVLLLLLSMLATLLALIVRPFLQRPSLCGERFRLARFGSMR